MLKQKLFIIENYKKNFDFECIVIRILGKNIWLFFTIQKNCYYFLQKRRKFGFFLLQKDVAYNSKRLVYDQKQFIIELNLIK